MVNTRRVDGKVFQIVGPEESIIPNCTNTDLQLIKGLPEQNEKLYTHTHNFYRLSLSLPWNYMSVPHGLNRFSENACCVLDITIQSDQLDQTKTLVTSDAGRYTKINKTFDINAGNTYQPTRQSAAV